MPRRMMDVIAEDAPRVPQRHFPSAEFRITANPGFHHSQIHGKWPSAEAAPATEQNPNPLNFSSLQGEWKVIIMN
jgi:hypothetical protein